MQYSVSTLPHPWQHPSHTHQGYRFFFFFFFFCGGRVEEGGGGGGGGVCVSEIVRC